MAKWTVNENYQVFIGEKRYTGGDTFSASDDEVDEYGARPYVSEAGKAKDDDDDESRQQSAPKAANKAVAAPEPNVVKAPVQPDAKSSGAKKP